MRVEYKQGDNMFKIRIYLFCLVILLFPIILNAGIANGDFETGSLSSWTVSNSPNGSSAKAVPLGYVNTFLPVFPTVHNGNYSAEIYSSAGQDFPNHTGYASISQDVFIPSDDCAVDVWLAAVLSTYHSDACGVDPLAPAYVDFQASDSGGVMFLEKKWDTCTMAGNLVGDIQHDTYVYLPWRNESINITGHAGQTVTIKFSAYDCSDWKDVSWLYVDDLQIICTTPTSTITKTVTPTITGTVTPTVTETNTFTVTQTITETITMTDSASITQTSILPVTYTATRTVTITPTFIKAPSGACVRVVKQIPDSPNALSDAFPCEGDKSAGFYVGTQNGKILFLGNKPTSKLGLEIKRQDGNDSTCVSDSQNFRADFQITNYDTVNIDVTTLSVKMWFYVPDTDINNHPQVAQIVSDPTVNLNMHPYGTTETGVVPATMSLRKLPGVCIDPATGKKANYEVIITFHSAGASTSRTDIGPTILPPGGVGNNVQVAVVRNVTGFGPQAPFDQGCDDYSITYDHGDYHSDPRFGLYQNNMLVTEWTASGSSINEDYYTGHEPCGNAYDPTAYLDQNSFTTVYDGTTPINDIGSTCAAPAGTPGMGNPPGNVTWMVGDDGLILYNDGTGGINNWQKLNISPYCGSKLLSVDVIDKDNVFATGEHGIILKLHAGPPVTYTQVSPVIGDGTCENYYAKNNVNINSLKWLSSGLIMAVGTDNSTGTGIIIFSKDGGNTWLPSIPTPHGLNAIFNPDDGTGIAWIAGDAGYMTEVTFTGSAYSIYDGLNVGTSENLLAVAGGSPTNLAAVGTNGIFVRYDGKTWNANYTNADGDLKDILYQMGDFLVICHCGEVLIVEDCNTPTPTVTNTITPTPTLTPDFSATNTPDNTSTSSPTPTPTYTQVSTCTDSPTPGFSPTFTSVSTPDLTAIATAIGTGTGTGGQVGPDFPLGAIGPIIIFGQGGWSYGAGFPPGGGPAGPGGEPIDGSSPGLGTPTPTEGFNDICCTDCCGNPDGPRYKSIWAVGNHGLVMHYMEGYGVTRVYVPSPPKSPTTRDLYEVDCFTNQQIWISGQDGYVVWSPDGGVSWNELPDPPGTTGSYGNFVGMHVSASGTGLVYFTSTNGYIYIWDRDISKWKTPPVYISSSGLNDIQETGTGIWVIGNNGEIDYSTDNLQTVQNMSGNLPAGCGIDWDTINFKDMSVISPSELYVVGSKGVVLHITRNGGSWRFDLDAVSSPCTPITNENLNSIYAADAFDIVVAGDHGTILQHGWNKATMKYDWRQISLPSNWHLVAICGNFICTPDFVAYNPFFYSAPDVPASAGQGTATISQNNLPAGISGVTETISYTAGTTPVGNAEGPGAIVVKIPPGWSAPSLNPLDPGYIHVTAVNGTVADVRIDGNTIYITGNLAANTGAISLTYGSKDGGGPGLSAPGTPGSDVFSIFTTTEGNLLDPKPLAVSPVVVLTGGTPTATETLVTSTPTFTITPTFTGTPTYTVTETTTPTFTVTSTLTETPTYTVTETITPTFTVTATRTETQTYTVTETITVTFTMTPTFTVTSTSTVTQTTTPTSTVTSTCTETPTYTVTATTTPTFTITPTMTETPTYTITATITSTFTVTATSSDTPTSTITSTVTPTSTETLTSSGTPTFTITSTITETTTQTPSFTATSTITATPSITVTRTFTAIITNTATPDCTKTWQYVGIPEITAGSGKVLKVQVDKTTGTPYIAFQDGNNANKIMVMEFDGNAWVNVGDTGSYGDDWAADGISLFLYNSIPYVAFKDYNHGDFLSVMSYDKVSGLWNYVGGSPAISPGSMADVSMYIYNDIVYTAIIDMANGNKMTVMEHPVIGGVWSYVGGAPGISTGKISFPSMSVDADGNPYVGYTDFENANGMTVKEFYNNSWQTLGVDGISKATANWSSIFVENNTVYAAYCDYANSAKASVLVYDRISNTWNYLGNPGFTQNQVNWTALYVENGVPYLLYEEMSSGFRATVQRFTDNSWGVVGTASFSSGAIKYTTIFLNDGVPYVAFTNPNDNNRASVMKFDCAPAVLVTATDTPTVVFTATSTVTTTITGTSTQTCSASPTCTQTFTVTCTITPSATKTVTPTSTVTPSITRTITPTGTPTRTQTRTATRTITPTSTRTCTPALTITPTSTSTITPTQAPVNITLKYKSSDNGVVTGSPKPYFRLYNNSSSPLALSRVEIRYWYSYEGAVQAEQRNLYYAGRLPAGINIAGNTVLATVTGTFGDQNRYLKVTFGAGAGSLAQNDYAEIQTEFNKQDWSPTYTQTNDWSYANYADWTNWNNVTVYIDGVLTWGTSPGSGTLAVNHKNTPIASKAEELSETNAYNYPNPFSVGTAIRFSLAEPVEAVIKIGNINGQLVWQKVIPASDTHAGINEVLWDAVNENGITAANGVYIYNIRAGNRAVSKKLAIIK